MSPFRTSKEKSYHIQSYTIIALIPIIMWSTYVFGTRTLSLMFFSVFTSTAIEFLFFKINNNLNNINPLRSIISGILAALILPVSVPFSIAALSGFIVSVIINISLTINLGYNIINPVAASSIILFSLFRSVNHGFSAPFETLGFFQGRSDISIVNSVLDSIQEGTDSITNSTLINTFLGRECGNMGEVSILLIIVAFLFLIYKKSITFHIPVAFIATVFLISFFLPVGNCEAIYCATTEIFSGGVVFAAVFVAPLPTASPMTNTGKIIFGIGCGLVTMILRRYLFISDGAMFGVAFMSCFSYSLDTICGNKYFSYNQDKHKNKIPPKPDLDALLNNK